jgi:hypothetical protein
MTGEIGISTQLQPLKLRCSMSDCATDRHYFLASKKLKAVGESPKCRDCKVDLIDWNKLHRLDLNDVDYTFHALKFELIRHVYWHRNIDERAMNYAKRKGKLGLIETAEHFLRKYIAKPADAFSSISTSMDGNPIHYAQHATATCCRRCIEKWHGIPPDRYLQEDEILYFLRLVQLFINDRFPELPNRGCKVPPIRKRLSRREA